jgi:ATP-binding cassette subfamily G (WHITE) protein 2 (PDR)
MQNRVINLMNEKNIVQRKAGFVFRDLKVSGTGSSLHLQKTVGTFFTWPFRLGELFHKGKERVILNKFDGVVKTGELLVVLGRPGSGCSTLLKTLTGELQGLNLDKDSVIHYNGKSSHP